MDPSLGCACRLPLWPENKRLLDAQVRTMLELWVGVEKVGNLDTDALANACADFNGALLSEAGKAMVSSIGTLAEVSRRLLSSRRTSRCPRRSDELPSSSS